MSHWCQSLCPRAPEPANCAVALDFVHRIRPCTADFWKYPSSRRRLWDFLLIAKEKKRYSNTFLTATLELSKFIGFWWEKQTRWSKINLVHLLIVNFNKKSSEFIHGLWLNHQTNVSLEMKVSEWIPGLRSKIVCWFVAESGWRVAGRDNSLSWWSDTCSSSAMQQINKSIKINK